MRIKISSVILGILFVASSVSPVLAEDEGGGLWPVPDYKGDIWERPALSGDWGGSRSDMADKGITVSLDLLSTFQAL